MSLGTFNYEVNTINQHPGMNIFTTRVLLIFIVLLIPISGYTQDELKISNLNKNNYEVNQLMMGKQYVDRPYIIQKFPSFLLGAKLIRTANDDKSSKGEDFLTFRVNRDVSIFVAHWSTIKVVPKWLKESFKKTELRLNSGEEDYYLYKNDFPVGLISLGGNIESEEEDHAMYSVIIADQCNIPDSIEYAIRDYKSLLCEFDKYEDSSPIEIPAFKYQDQNDSILVQIRNDLRLDQIVESKDEISRIIDLMKWANQRIKHNGSNNLHDTRSMKIIEGFEESGEGVNCRAMSIILNDIYLAMGFKSRIVSCMPHEDYDTESHVTNLVYSESLNKWIYMDPTFSAYVTDENGTILNHSEIRKAIILGEILNVEGGLIHNGTPYEGGQNNYLDYMTKNLFRLGSPSNSNYGYEYANPDKIFIYLYPAGYKDNVIDYYKLVKGTASGYIYYIKDDKRFFERPVL
jgi:hypothetical protein